MKKVGVVPNEDKDHGLEFTREIVTWLAAQNCLPLLHTETALELNLPQYGAESDKIYGQSDFVVVLGGDGTILNVASASCKAGTPLLGINLGTLGYLAEVEVNGAFDALTKALSGDYSLQKRMMLEVSVEGKSKSVQADTALNDACVLKGNMAKLISTRLEINGEYINTIRSDGIIVSTPTGSTAYNLSAGGPILKPDGEMMAITPICPHTLYSRPFVISADDVVAIKVESGFSGNSILMLDGHNRGVLDPGDVITIRRSMHRCVMLNTNDLGFYDILRRKMMMNN